MNSVYGLGEKLLVDIDGGVSDLEKSVSLSKAAVNLAIQEILLISITQWSPIFGIHKSNENTIKDHRT